MRFVRFAAFATALFVAVLARAQSVRWQQDESGFGNTIQLVFQDCEPDGDPQLPAIPDATLTFQGSATSVNIINLNVSRSLIVTYAVESKHGGALRIPAFTVKTNKGPIRVAAFDGAGPSITADSVATSHLVPSRRTVWAGEVFDLSYAIEAARRNNPQFDSSFVFDWNPAPLVAEQWSKPAVTETSENNQRQVVLTYHTRAYAKLPGRITLSAAKQIVHVQTGAIGFGLFSQAQMEPVAITSNRPAVTVQPLPAPPDGFAGAVGEFKLTSKVVPTTATVGDPVTWTLELSGTGNWPDIPGLPSRQVSKDFQVIESKPKRTSADGNLFDATLSEDVVLIPGKPGTYTLGPVAFTFFNPRSGTYETVHTGETTVTINAQPAAPTINAGISGGAQPGEPAEAALTAAPRVPGAPAGIPRDPLLGHAAAATPLAPGTLTAWLIAPFATLILFWLALAWRRAARTDPLRPQREAHARLTALLTTMRGHPVTAAELLQWQHDSAALWRVSHAAPSADALAAPDQAAKPVAAHDGAWATLWREADRALYGRNGGLPSDWVARAEAALAAKRIPGFKPSRLFLPRNLLAFAAAVAVLLSLAPRMHAAEEAPDAAYRGGNFAAAAAGWQDAVNRTPTNWIARHNLSLALAQQNKPGPAAAQAAVAFVQQPDNDAVRWHFALMARTAGFVPAPLAAFLKEGPTSAVAGLASPAVWQRLLIVSAIIFAAALGWLLLNGYGARSRRIAWAAGTVGGLAVLLGCFCGFGIHAYGDLADRRAVVTWQAGTLRSIPTEADTTQKTTVLPAGSVAVVDKTFLGAWDRLEFANGQTGWVRKEDVIPVWTK